MKIILLKDVKGSGKKDQIVDVKDGFANFLIKSGSARPVTSKNLNELNTKNSAKEFHKQEEKDNAIKLSEMLEGKKISIELKSGKDGGLFGSVTTKDISDKILEVFGVEVDKHKVCLDKNIKECGTYEVKVKLYPEITAKIILEVISD